MHVIALCSQKGGSGKTTLAGHLGVQAELIGQGPVALIDTDPRGSLAAWWHRRHSAAPSLASTTLAELPGDIERLRLEGCRLVLIVTSAMSAAIQRVINLATMVIIPIRPSPHDLRTVADMVSMVERAHGNLMFVINAANLRAKITSDAVVELARHGTVAPVFIQHRVDFATSMVDGRTVCELDPEGRSAKEIRLLWDYIAGQLEKCERQRVFHQPMLHGFGRRASQEQAKA